MDTQQLTIARFRNKRDNQAVEEAISWQQLCELLTQHTERAVKDGQALWSPTAYGEKKTRANANVVSVCALVLDFDSGVPPEEFTRGWERWAYVMHTTYSHTLECPRWRVAFPFTEPVIAQKWPAIWPRLSQFFGGNATDPSCKDASRMYYLPACAPDAPRAVHEQDGEWINPGTLFLPTPELLVSMAKGHLHEGRNNAGVWLACQGRDNKYSQADVEGFNWHQEVVREKILPNGKVDVYDEQEWRETVRKVFGSPAREAWSISHSNGRHAPEAAPPAVPQIRSPHLTERLVATILPEDHFAKDGGSRLYVFQSGVYKPRGEDYLHRRAQSLLLDWGEKWTQHRGREVVEYIRINAPTLWEQPPLDTVNVANGLVDAATGRLRDHDPDFLSPIQIPVRFDPKADCGDWEEFIETTFPEDAQEVAWEVAAWMMTPMTSIQKAILLLGEGSNGKSTYLRGLTAFLGRQNTVALSLQKLESDRFAASRLVGKLANICPDLPSVHLTDTSMFKAITGGDYIAAEYKHLNGFDFKPFCHLIFSANHPPQSSDASHAFFRRWLVVPFTRSFEGATAKPADELDAQLARPKQLSGLLNRALIALPRLCRHGFTEPGSMQEAWAELRSATDPLAVWLDREIEEDPAQIAVKEEVWRDYNRDCESHGRPYLAQNSFWRSVRRLRPSLEFAQRTVNDKVREVALGWRIRNVIHEEPPSKPDPRLS